MKTLLAANVLTILSELLITAFVIWSLFFYTGVDIGLVRGIFVFILAIISVGCIYFFIQLIPFVAQLGVPLFPLIFEWWIHDLWFGEFTSIAIYLTVFLFIVMGFEWFVIYRKIGESYPDEPDEPDVMTKAVEHLISDRDKTEESMTAVVGRRPLSDD